MTQRNWFGGTGDWTNAADWATAGAQPGAPVFGDSLVVPSGTVTLAGSEAPGDGAYDEQLVTLEAGSALALSSAVTGAKFSLDITGSAAITAIGASAFGGSIEVQEYNTLTFGSVASGSQPGDLTILPSASIPINSPETIDFTGVVTVEGTVEASSVINSGTIGVVGGTLDAVTLSGTGTIALGFSSIVYAGSVIGSGQTALFTGADAFLQLGTATSFGTIEGFQNGDSLDLGNVKADTATYNGTLHTLTLSTQSSGAVAAVLTNFYAASGTITAASDGSSGTLVGYAGQPSYVAAGLDSSDLAVGGQIVRQTMTVPGTNTPITGAGVKIGIISNSFDYHASGTADPANAAASAGYIPANTNGTSAVTILSDGTGDNEGLAMAELIHQIAPGATLDFATLGTTQTGFAAAIQALQQAGCNIIVDDIRYDDTPKFQLAGPIDTAVSAAIAGGVNYFTSAGNTGNDDLDSAFVANTATLYDGSVVQANVFDNGTVYEPIVIPSGATTAPFIELTWNASFYGTEAPALSMKLFNQSGTLLATATQDKAAVNASGTTPVAEETLTFNEQTVPAVPVTDYLAIYLTGAASVSQFDLSFYTEQYGAIIGDNAAGAGGSELEGQELIPAVNTVGAAGYANSPQLGQSADYPEYFSNGGTASIYNDASGNPLSSPQAAGDVDFVAPDATNVPVTSFSPFTGTSAAVATAAAVAALVLQANPNLTTTQISNILDASAIKLTDTTAADQGAGLIQAPAAVTLAEAACYAQGTRILSLRGEIAIEALRPGDRLVTAGGAVRPVAWTGRRDMHLARHPRPWDVMPICIRADAFAPGSPVRDLILSPDHAIFADGVLIPVRYLLNGASIVQETTDRIVWWHVELDRHDVILAEGLPSESYLDTGNRAAFDGCGPTLQLHPDFARAARHTGFAPLVLDGAIVTRQRRRLLARLPALGYAVTRDPALRILAGETEILPQRNGDWLRLCMPGGPASLRLVSRIASPAELDPASRDCRRLGLGIAALHIDGRSVPLDSAIFAQGWLAPEPDLRWTGGDAELIIPSGGIVEFRLSCTLLYHATCAVTSPAAWPGSQTATPARNHAKPRRWAQGDAEHHA